MCLLSEKQLFFLLLYFSFSAGCYPLRHGDCKAGATSLLQGSGIVAGVGAGRGWLGWGPFPALFIFYCSFPHPGPLACWHPPHAPHRAHVCVSGTASQTLWYQSAILTGLWEWAEPCPVPSASFFQSPDELSAALSPAPARRAPAAPHAWMELPPVTTTPPTPVASPPPPT